MILKINVWHGLYTWLLYFPEKFFFSDGCLFGDGYLLFKNGRLFLGAIYHLFALRKGTIQLGLGAYLKKYSKLYRYAVLLLLFFDFMQKQCITVYTQTSRMKFVIHSTLEVGQFKKNRKLQH